MKGKILVIDDDVTSGKIIAWAMESLGHNVRLAADGASALEVLDSYIPDVVICDISMPDMNGYQVVEAMKTRPDLKHTMFIAQTGWDCAKRRNLSREAGYAHHLVKPVYIRNLARIIHTHKPTAIN